MVLITLYGIKPILHLVARFHERYKDDNTVAAMTVRRMVESYKTTPTYIKAVKNEKGKYIAYLWASVLGGICFIQHIYSENRKARTILMSDLEDWCRKRYVLQIGGMRKIGLNTKAFGRWMRSQGYRPQQVLYMKVLPAKAKGT